MQIIYVGGHALTREALCGALGGFGMDVTAVGSLQDAFDFIARAEQVDAILVDDDGLTDERLLEIVARCNRHTSAAISVIAGPRAPALPAAAIRAGARAFLSRDMPLFELRVAIERTIAGSYLVDPAIARQVLGAFAGIVPAEPACERPALKLTPIEERVLSLASDGKANKQIAHTLGLSPLTVKNHIARIRARLGAADKAHAVAVALRNGLIR